MNATMKKIMVAFAASPMVFVPDPFPIGTSGEAPPTAIVACWSCTWSWPHSSSSNIARTAPGALLLGEDGDGAERSERRVGPEHHDARCAKSGPSTMMRDGPMRA
jgi:hypothetical protein